MQQRVQIHPACDMWMRGDRFGRVVRTSKRRSDGATLYHVRLEISGKVLRLPDDLIVNWY